MKICPNCGRENGDTSKFCAGCGTKLEEASKFCPGCGAELEDHARFCSKCGYALTDETTNNDVYAEYEDSNYADDSDSSDDYEEYVDEDEYEDDETTEEKIRKIVDKYIYDINKSSTAYNSTKLHNPEYSQVLQNLRSNIAKDASSSEIIGFIDTTLFGKGKSGLVFTTEALYEKSPGFRVWKVPYWQMHSMDFNGKEIKFNGTEDCGNSFLGTGLDVTVNNSYYNLPALKDCLDEIYAII